MRFITALTGISALLIAGCAAFFSVTGLGLLFSGAMYAVIIMAASLEIGKLVAASYLHHYWKHTNIMIRTYLITGIIILVLITSAGIFGFLSNAYTQTQIGVAQVESEISFLDSQKESSISDIPRWENRIQTLSDNRTRQEVRYDSLVANSNWVNARITTNLINEANSEISDLGRKIESARVVADSIDALILQTRKDNIEIEREIGGFRFVAQSFNVDTDTVVKWFIFLLIFVFDPMAVVMVIAFNNALSVDLKTKNSTAQSNNIPDSTPPEYEATRQLDLDINEDHIQELTKDSGGDKIDKGEITHYKVKTAGGHVVIKAKYYDPENHKDAEPIYAGTLND